MCQGQNGPPTLSQLEYGVTRHTSLGTADMPFGTPDQAP